MKFVICGKDCNKHESKIFACFDSLDMCIKYLNKKGEELTGVVNFDINAYKINDEEYQECSFFNVTFEHVELFKQLYATDNAKPNCTHKGAIHIGCIDRGDNFSEIYEWLSETYM